MEKLNKLTNRWGLRQPQILPDIGKGLKEVAVMYSKGFVVAIVADGKISSESMDGNVALPFGSEYSVRLRNKNNRRAVASVRIDNEHIGNIVVNANSYVDLERQPHGNYTKFKFVSSESEEAIDFGKNNKTDRSNGVIRVEWKLEQERMPVQQWSNSHHPWRSPPVYGSSRSLKGGEEYCERMVGGQFESKGLGFMPDTVPTSAPLSEGCTVEGSYSSQRFTTMHVDLEPGDGVVIQLVLKGFQPIRLKQCQTQNCINYRHDFSKADNYCNNCGGLLV